MKTEAGLLADLAGDSEKLDSLGRSIRNQRRLFLEEWHHHALTVEQLTDNANLGKIEKILEEVRIMAERKADKQNQESGTIVRHGDIEPPVREVFSNKELNRLTEVRENSSEQENNSKGNRKSKMSMVSEGIRRHISRVLVNVAPRLSLPIVPLTIGRR